MNTTSLRTHSPLLIKIHKLRLTHLTQRDVLVPLSKLRRMNRAREVSHSIMADTKQSVKWMLEQTCPLRKEDEWSNELLGKARTYGEHVVRPDDSFGMLDGICVTGKRRGRESDLLVPTDGFDATQVFAPLTGDGLQQMCGACPAHAAEIAAAGCGGWLYIAPGSAQLDDNLREVVADLGLVTDVEREFLPTRLLWFGLWAESPLSVGALQVMEPLLGEYARRFESSSQRTDLENFVSAVGAALQHNLILHVRFSPPGHTDFGWHSVFAHCPRCKAGAPVHPWKETPSLTLECEMCGELFDPATTAHHEAMERPERSDLLESLGAERYRDFAVGYLLRRGASEAEARKIVEDRITPNPEIERRIQLAREKSARKRHWIRTVLFAGMGELIDPNTKGSTATLYRFGLSAAEVELLLQRCLDWNVEISSIRHKSDEEQWDGLRASTAEFGTIETAFTDLLAQGCNERFYIGALKVPDELTETETATAPEEPEQSP